MSIHNSRQISDVKILLKTGVDGAGIVDIEKTGTSGNIDTYTITLSNGSKYTFTVTNGNGIASVEKTGTHGLVDTYTITFDNGETETFTVTNGKDGRDGGMSTLFLITSDAGSTVTVTLPSGTEVTASQVAGSTIQWECESTEFGVHTVTSVLDGDSVQTSVTVDSCRIYNVNVNHFNATISVTYPSGATCTCVGSGETLTATSNPYTFRVHSADTYTITATDGTHTKTEQVTITTEGQSESITLSFFSATISVTYPSGATCTCVGGGETLTATSNPYTFTVQSADTYTITATDGTNTRTETVTITIDGQSESIALSFIPDGSTVTPTDDIQTWLNCADIWDKNYTTISEVLADSTTLSALIADSNAVDYMVRSTTWTTNVCSNQTAMSYIGLDDNCADTLLADSTWSTAICNSTYYESVLNVKVPTMTSNTTPSGKARCSSAFYSDAYQAFDGNDSEGWSANVGGGGQWVSYEFPTNVTVYKFRIIHSETFIIQIRYKIQGSNDNSSWVDITPERTVGNGTSQVPSEDAVVNISSPSSYKYYRLYYTSEVYQNGSRYGKTKTLQFYGRA